jgi:hypothetical protein
MHPGAQAVRQLARRGRLVEAVCDVASNKIMSGVDVNMKNMSNESIDPDYDDNMLSWPSGWWILPIAVVVLCGLSVLVAWACSAWGAPAGW